MHDFPREWRKAFETLNIHGSEFLNLDDGTSGTFTMYEKLYPFLVDEYNTSGKGWDPPEGEREGKRLRVLIVSIGDKTAYSHITTIQNERSGASSDRKRSHYS